MFKAQALETTWPPSMVTDLYILQDEKQFSLVTVPFYAQPSLQISPTYSQISPNQKTFLCVYLNSYGTPTCGVNAEKQTKSYIHFNPNV